jgi:GNAT superfamily N-acetyltransferase
VRQRHLLWQEQLADDAWLRDRLKKRAQNIHPDSVFTESAEVRPGMQKLRKIRDLIKKRNPTGQSVSPKDLPPGDWSAGRLPNGNISAQKIDEVIKSVTPIKYNLSASRYEFAQLHNSQPSKVLQVNLSTEHVRQMQEAGVYKTFQDMAKASQQSGHPVLPQTLGWVRYTGDSRNGYFIDEVQSDFGQSFVKQAAQQAREQGSDPDEAAAAAQKRWPDEHYNVIKKILFGGRHSNEILHEAFLQHLRDKGYHNAKIHVHTVESKAPISLGKALPKQCKVCGVHENKHGRTAIDTSAHEFVPFSTPGVTDWCQASGCHQKIDGPKHQTKIVDHAFEPGGVDRLQAPGHMNVTYHDVPRKMGYEPSTYGKLKTQTGNWEANDIGPGAPTWEGKVRKTEEDLGGPSVSTGPRPHIKGAEHVRQALDEMHTEIDHRYNHIHAHAQKLGVDPDSVDTGSSEFVPEHCRRCKAFPVSQDSIGICTSTARHLANKLGGRVMGYADAHRVGAAVGEGDGEGGHDFAVIDGRYIGDWWANSYGEHPDLHDMQDPGQHQEIRRLYGDPSKWVEMRDDGVNLEKRVLDPNAGYKFSHGVNAGMSQVHVHTAAGEHVGAATFMHHGPGLKVGSVVVDDAHQRRGVASAMYAHAEKMTGKKIQPSPVQTPEGQALWAGNAVSPQFGKSEAGFRNKKTGTVHRTGSTHDLLQLPEGLDTNPEEYEDGFMIDGEFVPRDEALKPREPAAPKPVRKDEALIWLATQPLVKMAMRPKDMGPVARYHDPIGSSFVDDEPEVQAHPPAHEAHVQAFKRHVLDPEADVKRGRTGTRESSNSTGKIVYNVKAKIGDSTENRFMIKPYHEKVVPRVRDWMQYPIQGWAEMTNQALYHAGGIGDLHQKVHVARVPMEQKSSAKNMHSAWHREFWTARRQNDDVTRLIHGGPSIRNEAGENFSEFLDRKRAEVAEAHKKDGVITVPALVVHMQQNVTTAGNHRGAVRYPPGTTLPAPWAAQVDDPWTPENKEQARRIALMDFVTNNLDRHEFNLLYDYDKQKLMAIDHSRSFQYKNVDKRPLPRQRHELYDRLSNYIKDSFLRTIIPRPVKATGSGGGWDQQKADNDFYTAVNEYNRSWDETFAWWKKHSQPIREQMQERLKLIRDRGVREHVRQNYETRHKAIDDYARDGHANYGTDNWDQHQVPVYKPGEVAKP